MNIASMNKQENVSKELNLISKNHDVRLVVCNVRYIEYNLVYVQFVILSLNPGFQKIPSTF